MWDWLKKIKLPETDDSPGDRILNNTIKEANNASTQEERDNIYKDRAKKTLAVTGQSLMAIPMLGEFATYGLLGGGLRLGAGMAGSKAGEYVLGKGGDWADKKLGTNWIGTAGRIGGGLMGFGLGTNATTPLLRSAAAKGITMHIPQETFSKLRNEAFANWSKKTYNRKLYVNPQESLTNELIDWPKGKGVQFHVDRHTFPDLNRDWNTNRVLSDWSNKWGKEYVKDGMMLPGKAGSSLDEYIWFSEDHPYQIPTNNNFIIGSAKDLRTAKNQLVQGTPIPFPLTKGFPVNGKSIEYYKYLPIEKHPGTFGATIGTSGPTIGTYGRVKFHEPIPVSPQEAATTYHYDPRVDLLSRPISAAEKTGIPKVERNIKTHGTPQAPYYDYSLINRSYEPWTVNDEGQFVFASPEVAKKLASIHFSLNEPVRAHIQGSWDDAPITTILPYRNIRSQTAPVDIAIMDTFFPNYNGLKIRARGSKTLTGDKAVYDYYKSKGLDVEHSPELESLLGELKTVREQLDRIPANERYAITADARSPEVISLNAKEAELSEKIDAINRNWTEAHVVKIPSFEKLTEFGKSEGLPMEESPYQLGSPKRDAYGRPLLEEESNGLNYNWISDPSNHAGVVMNPESLLKSINSGEYKVTPEYKKFVEWLVTHKADYRKKGGKIPSIFKDGGVIKSQHGNKFLDTWQRLHDSKFGNTMRNFLLGSQETNEFGEPKYIGSSGMLGMLVLPEFEGLEFPEITAMHYGMKGKPIGNAIDAERLTTVPKAISNTAKTKAVDQSFNKFLEKSTQEQDNIVRYWNGENFSNYQQLQRNPSQLKRFKNWLKKK